MKKLLSILTLLISISCFAQNRQIIRVPASLRYVSYIMKNSTGDSIIYFINGVRYGYRDSAITYWTKSGNNIYNNNSANVGIGNTSPANKFSVYAPVTADAVTEAMFAPSASNRKAVVIQGLASQSATLFELQTSAGSPIMLFDNINRSQINMYGKTTGSAAVQYYRDGPSLTDHAYMGVGIDLTGNAFGSPSGSIIVSGKNGSGTQQPLILGGYSGSFVDWVHMAIDGRVGIGSTSPNAWLDIKAGTTAIGQLQMRASSVLTTPVAGTFTYVTNFFNTGVDGLLINSTNIATGNKLTINTPNTTDGAAEVLITASTTGKIPLKIEGSASHAASLFEAVTSTGALVTTLDNINRTNLTMYGKTTASAAVLNFRDGPSTTNHAYAGFGIDLTGNAYGSPSGVQIVSGVNGSGTQQPIIIGGYNSGFTEWARFITAGRLGLGVTAPTGILHIKAGTATASTAPLKLTYTSSALNTTIEAGTIETNTSSPYASTAALNRFAMGGKIYGTSTDVSNTSTTETDLITYTTKANTLVATDESLVFDLAGTFNDATATAQLQFYFAGTNIGNTGTLTLSATGGWTARVIIIRSGSTTAKAMVTVTTPGASTAQYTTVTSMTGLTFSGTNIIKCTGIAGGAGGGTGDITGSAAQLMWWGSTNN